MTVTALIVLALATWRITFMVVDEDGPGDIFRRWRKLVRAGEFNPALIDPDRLSEQEYLAALGAAHVPVGLLGKLCSCPYCFSVWAAAGCYLLWLLPELQWIVCISAVAGAAALILKVIDGIQRPPTPPVAG